MPGFADFPNLLADDDEPRNGFEISEAEVDRDSWTEGYVTMTLADTIEHVHKWSENKGQEDTSAEQ